MNEQPEEKKESCKKRKKSVHFPKNHVIPIDDSSFENSDEDLELDVLRKSFRSSQNMSSTNKVKRASNIMDNYLSKTPATTEETQD